MKLAHSNNALMNMDPEDRRFLIIVLHEKVSAGALTRRDVENLKTLLRLQSGQDPG